MIISTACNALNIQDAIRRQNVVNSYHRHIVILFAQAAVSLLLSTLIANNYKELLRSGNASNCSRYSSDFNLPRALF